MQENVNAFDIVVYHRNCLDGITAAAVYHKYALHHMEKKHVAGVKYYAAQYGDDPFVVPDEVLLGKRVLMLDFSLPKAELLRLSKLVKHLVIIDHHETAQKQLHDFPQFSPSNTDALHLHLSEGNNVIAHFNMRRCGAVLTYQHLFPELPLPLCLQYAEDRDLWNNSMTYTKEVQAWMQSFMLDDVTPQLWYKLVFRQMFDGNLTNIRNLGAEILRYQSNLISEVLKNSFGLQYLIGYVVPIFNAPKSLISDTCDRILTHPDYNNFPYCAGYYLDGEHRYVFSLRSRKDRPFAVNNLAEIFGGGGHTHAAGFITKEWPSNTPSQSKLRV